MWRALPGRTPMATPCAAMSTTWGRMLKGCFACSSAELAFWKIHIVGERLSPMRISLGFGLTREDSPYEPGDPEYGDFSSLNRTMLIKEH